MKKTKLAVIVGNRDFFPDALVTEARQDVLAVFDEMGIKSVMLSEEDTNLGGVETWEDAQKCAALFKANQDNLTATQPHEAEKLFVLRNVHADLGRPPDFQRDQRLEQRPRPLPVHGDIVVDEENDARVQARHFIDDLPHRTRRLAQRQQYVHPGGRRQ